INDTSLISSTLISSAFLSSAAFTTICNNSSNFKIRPPILVYLSIHYTYEYYRDKVLLFYLINTYLFCVQPSMQRTLNHIWPFHVPHLILENLELAQYNLLQKLPCQHHSYMAYQLCDSVLHQLQFDLLCLTLFVRVKSQQVHATIHDDILINL